ncbi:MAG: GerMN domain-containing protein [Lachnospirales bacterium]
MKLNRKIVYILLVILFIGIIFSFAYSYYEQHDNALLTEESAFLFNSKNYELARTNHYVDYNKSKEEIIRDLYNLLATYTEEGNLTFVVPKSVSLINFELDDDGILYLNFDSAFNEISSMEASILKSSLVWSMTSLNFVNGVIFEVEDIELINNFTEDDLVFDRSNIIINPKFNSAKVVNKSLVLYFPKADSSGMLYTEIRDTLTNEEYSEERIVVEELLKGTTLENATGVFPKDTKLRDISTADGICQIDLSSNFVTNNSNIPAEQVASVYAIVNSLTEIKYIDKVQFLIESKKTNPFNSVDISQPLTKETKYIE